LKLRDNCKLSYLQTDLYSPENEGCNIHRQGPLIRQLGAEPLGSLTNKTSKITGGGFIYTGLLSIRKEKLMKAHQNVKDSRFTLRNAV